MNGSHGYVYSGASLAYIRVSSRQQDYATQRHAIERFAALRGDSIVEWRAEKKSAKTMDRPELKRLMSEAKAGALRGRRLYLYRLDRLTRTGIKDTLQAIEDLRGGGVELVSLQDGIDLIGPHAEIIIATMAWASQMERLATNERIAAARERLEREGRPWGRPSRLSAEEVEKIVCMHMSGKSTRSISMALKVHRSVVARAIKNRTTAEAASQKDRAEREAQEQALRAADEAASAKGTLRQPSEAGPQAPIAPREFGGYPKSVCPECHTTDLKRHGPDCSTEMLVAILNKFKVDGVTVPDGDVTEFVNKHREERRAEARLNPTPLSRPAPPQGTEEP